eukprot:SAG22_NODE_12069_length_457_cov_1.142458_1_plen_110_part_10
MMISTRACTAAALILLVAASCAEAGHWPGQHRGNHRGYGGSRGFSNGGQRYQPQRATNHHQQHRQQHYDPWQRMPPPPPPPPPPAVLCGQHTDCDAGDYCSRFRDRHTGR